MRKPAMKKASFVRGEKTMSKTVLGLIASSSVRRQKF